MEMEWIRLGVFVSLIRADWADWADWSDWASWSNWAYWSHWVYVAKWNCYPDNRGF